MMNRIINFLPVLLLLMACSKEEYTIHSGFSRINYHIENPAEMANLSFKLDGSYDLMGFTNCSITMIADDHAPNLSLSIMLEDAEGHRTDQSPFTLTRANIYKDGMAHTYTYDFDDNLESSSGPDNAIDIRQIKRVIIFINSGEVGEADKGYFWLEKLEFTATE